MTGVRPCGGTALGDRSFYAPADLREVSRVTDVLVPSGRWQSSSPRRWEAGRCGEVAGRSPLVLAGAAAVAPAVPHAVVSWHSDGMEMARHLVVPLL